ncbi:MAG: hypothetical protein CVV14_00570 [Gammaproteobacteria bacterium HGW-Gammaproteobacteria-4]|nr:MAG: hypothetical protein CVV14_00570 [Gammaproteobacteria bacterium HGW-Gammaproteobacteria-4]
MQKSHAIEVDATMVAHGLALEPTQFRDLMARGKVRVLCERGIGEDEGQYRVTFYYRRQRHRFVTDLAGNLIT